MLINEWFLKSFFYFVFSGRNSQKEKRLYDAAKHGHLATVKELIKTTYVDPTPEYGIEYGYTPLIWAGKTFLSSYSVLQI